MGRTFLFLSQKRNSKPVGFEGVCALWRGRLCEKGFGSRIASKLALGFRALFQFVAQSRPALPSGLLLGWVVREGAAVSLRRNERDVLRRGKRGLFHVKHL